MVATISFLICNGKSPPNETVPLKSASGLLCRYIDLDCKTAPIRTEQRFRPDAASRCETLVSSSSLHVIPGYYILS
jgi:hypothetical protein